jgi:hypothetical protein
VSELEELQAKNPATYRCGARCSVGAATKKALAECAELCPGWRDPLEPAADER